MNLFLKLQPIKVGQVRGIYRVDGIDERLPDRMRYLHPDAAWSFLQHCKVSVVVSDMLRTAESSLQAVVEGRGAQPPGYSGHNYGLSIDIDIKPTTSNLGLVSKTELDAWFEERGWFCHRRDHKLAFEAWHYNYLGPGAVISPKFKTTSGYIEAKILELYGEHLSPNDAQCQQALAFLKMYSGKIDGIVGKLTKAATGAFQRAWCIKATGVLDKKTRRTLAFVAAARATYRSA